MFVFSSYLALLKQNHTTLKMRKFYKIAPNSTVDKECHNTKMSKNTPQVGTKTNVFYTSVSCRYSQTNKSTTEFLLP